MSLCHRRKQRSPMDAQKPTTEYRKKHYKASLEKSTKWWWQYCSFFFPKTIFLEFVLVQPNPSVTVIFATQGQTESNSCHFIWAIQDLSSESRWNVVWNVFTQRPRGNRKRVGCLFTICIQSSFVTVPCSSFFPKPQRDTRWRFHFWPLCYTNS